MTMQLTTTFQMDATANAIHIDLEKTLQGALKNLQKTKDRTDARYAQWRDIAAQPAPMPVAPSPAESAPMAGMLLAALLDNLFGGLPLFQLFGGMMGDGISGAAGLGMMATADDTTTSKESLHRSAGLNSALKHSQVKKYRNASASQQAQMQLLQEMAALLLMNMAAQQRGETTTDGEGDEGLVPDVLRHPKMARFKQNRHSMSCIRTLFSHETDITVPRFTAPRYAM